MVDQYFKYQAVLGGTSLVNHGAMLGIGTDVRLWVFVTIFVIIVLDTIKRGFSVSDILILSGGLSNIIDRFLWGGVVDWIRLFSIWFNSADVLISLGVLLFILRTLERWRGENNQ